MCGETSGAVIFLDGGNVWYDQWDFNLNDLRYDVGPGLRYQTPIGPIRADLGFQLNPIPGLVVNGEAGGAALPLPLQHRAGVLATGDSDRRQATSDKRQCEPSAGSFRSSRSSAR